MDAIVRPDDPGPPAGKRLAGWICAALGHRPDAPPLWNHGHGFAACLRCGRPIVRTIVHGWRLPPRGYVIRWPDREIRHSAESQLQQVEPSPASPTRAEPVRHPAAARDSDDDFMQDPVGGSVSNGLAFDDFVSPPSPAPAPPRRRLPH